MGIETPDRPRRYGRRLFVPLRVDVLSALSELASAEDRAPVAQAAVLVADGLKQAGYLPPDWRPDRRRRAEDPEP